VLDGPRAGRACVPANRGGGLIIVTGSKSLIRPALGSWPVGFWPVKSSIARCPPVFGLTARFVEENPNTTLALIKALIRAGMWLDANGNANRLEAVQILSRPEYIGAEGQVIAKDNDRNLRVREG
jgi:ABC-type nitrate/sulfonate/bicarbonate transport system substrate-binding protein